MPKLTFEVDLHDGASPALEQIVEQAKAAGLDVAEGFKPATAALNQHAEAAGTLTNVVKEERQEHMRRMFAVREASGAVTELTGADSDLTKELNKGAGELFQMDFALKAAQSGLEKMGGGIGKLAAGASGLILPISAAIGVFAIMQEALKADDAESKQLDKDIVDLSEKLGTIPTDKVKDLSKDLADAEVASLHAHAAITQHITDWSIMWRRANDQLFGTHTLDEYVANIDKTMKKANLIVAGQINEDALAREAAQRKLDISIDNNAIQVIEQSKRTATQKLNAEQVFMSDKLRLEEAGEIAGVKNVDNAEDMKDIIHKEYSAKRAALGLEDAAKDKAISAQEVAEEKTAMDQENAELDIRRNRQTAIAVAQINLDKDVRESHALAADDNVRIDAKAQLDIINIEEQAAIREEFAKHQQDGDFKAIDTQYALQRTTLEQQTQNKIEAIWAKEVDENKKDAGLMEKAQDEVTTSLRTGFGNAIGEAIVNSQNLGEAFVAVGKRIVEQLVTMVAEAAIFDALMSLFSGGTTDLAALTAKYSASLSPGGGIPGPIPESFGGGGSAPISNGANSFKGSVQQANDGQSAQTGTTIVFNVSALDTKSFTDYVKQGSVSDALMSVVRKTIQTGR